MWRMSGLNYDSLGLPQCSLALFNHQATWLATKLADSTLYGPLLATCCATAAMFFVPAHVAVFMEFGYLIHLINIKENNSYHCKKNNSYHSSGTLDICLVKGLQ